MGLVLFIHVVSHWTSFPCPVPQRMWPIYLKVPFPMTGVPVNSRVSSKIQQLLNTLKRPKRPPLKEFFVDDMEELLEGKHPQIWAHVCKQGDHYIWRRRQMYILHGFLLWRYGTIKWYLSVGSPCSHHVWRWIRYHMGLLALFEQVENSLLIVKTFNISLCLWSTG